MEKGASLLPFVFKTLLELWLHTVNNRFFRINLKQNIVDWFMCFYLHINENLGFWVWFHLQNIIRLSYNKSQKFKWVARRTVGGKGFLLLFKNQPVWQDPLWYCKVISLQLIKINGKKKTLCAYLPSLVWLFATPWTIAHQAPLSMGVLQAEYWSGLPCFSPGDIPNPGIEPRSLTLQADSLPSEPPGKPPYLSK